MSPALTLRAPRRAPGAPLTARPRRLLFAAAAAVVAATAGCGGRDAPEDAPALLGTSIPAAAQNARGAPIPAQPAPAGGPSPRKVHPDLELPDIFGVPDPDLPEPPAAESSEAPGVEL